MSRPKAKRGGYQPPMKTTKRDVKNRHALALIMVSYRKMGYHDSQIASFMERDDKSGRHWVRSDISWYIEEYLDIDI